MDRLRRWSSLNPVDRNKASRNSFSDRVKGLGRDVKKMLKFKPIRYSKDEDAILSGIPGDASVPYDTSRHSVLSMQAGGLQAGGVQAGGVQAGGVQAAGVQTGHNPHGVYSGPFVGRAKVIRDYTPSPYDREALTLKEGDVISIISMNDTGMWRGMAQDRVGTFKFINVQMFTSDSPQQSPIRRQPRLRGPRKPPPRTVHELLLRIGLSHLTTLFLLHGYHTLELFSHLDEEDLDELCITKPEDRAKIITAAQLYVDVENIGSPTRCQSSRPHPFTSMLFNGGGSTDTLPTQGSTTATDTLSAPRRPASCALGLRYAVDLRDSGCYASNEALPHSDVAAAARYASEVGAGVLSTMAEELTTHAAVGSYRPQVNYHSDQEALSEGGLSTFEHLNTIETEPCFSEKRDVLATRDVLACDMVDCNATGTMESSTTSDMSVQSQQCVETAEDGQAAENEETVTQEPLLQAPTQDMCTEQQTNTDITVTTCAMDTEESSELSSSQQSCHVDQGSFLYPPITGYIPPTSSPVEQKRHSKSLPASPLCKHSPGSLLRYSPQLHSPMLQPWLQHSQCDRRSSPIIQSSFFTQHLCPQIPECNSPTSSPTSSQTSSASNDSFNSATPSPSPSPSPSHIDYDAQASLPHTCANLKFSHLHKRRLSSPAIQAQIAFFSAPSSQNANVYSASKTSSLPSELVVRGNMMSSRHKGECGTLDSVLGVKLECEGIDLTQPPYTDSSGFCGIPPALVQRYAEELRVEIAQVARAIDETRTRQLHNNGSFSVPNDFLADSCTTGSFDIDITSVFDFLVSIGLPMYMQAIVDNNLDTIGAVQNLRKREWAQLGVSDARHVRRLTQGTEMMRARLVHLN